MMEMYLESENEFEKLINSTEKAYAEIDNIICKVQYNSYVDWIEMVEDLEKVKAFLKGEENDNNRKTSTV